MVYNRHNYYEKVYNAHCNGRNVFLRKRTVDVQNHRRC